MEKPKIKHKRMTLQQKIKYLSAARKTRDRIAKEHDVLAHEIMRMQAKRESVPKEKFERIQELRKRLNFHEMNMSAVVSTMPPEVAEDYKIDASLKRYRQSF